MVNCMKRKEILKDISKLVMKKSTSHLKISMASFVFSIIILSISLVQVWNQYKTIQHQFVKNENTHVIEITGLYKDGRIEIATYDYVEEIKTILKDEGYDGGYDVFSMYQFSFGLDTLETDEGINVFAVDPVAEEYLLKDVEMEDGVLYTETPSFDETITVLLPEVTINDNGVMLGDAKEYSLIQKEAETNEVFKIYEVLEIKTYFVNFDTYKEMFRISYGEDFSGDALKKFQEVKPIYKVFVYVDDIADVESIAKTLNKADYMTNFVFQSFDEIGQALGSSLVIMLVVAVILTIFTIISLLLSFRAYINLGSKDIGILKQMGYSNKEVQFIYSSALHKMFLLIALVSSAITLVIATTVLSTEDLLYIAAYIIVLNVVLWLLSKVVDFTFLKKKVNENVLKLLKTNKEFE